MMRDLRRLYETEGMSGVVGLLLMLSWSIQCEYAIVRHGLRTLRTLLG
jgi:hypothetical protein